jgi:hypothetical protein
MRPITIDSCSITTLLEQQKIATLDELKSALGTNAPATIFRKLGQLDYLTSYSHGGRFYTLHNIVRFDTQGLWSFDSVWFSKHGTLLSTLKHLISTSQEGFFANQLKANLHVDVNTSVLKLFKQSRISREKIFGKFLYCSSEPNIRQNQIAKCRDAMSGQSTRAIVLGDDWTSDEIKAAIILFISLLDEQQRRLFAGLESMQFGHGGDKMIAELLGLDPHTVAKGRRQLLERDIQSKGVRAKGAGRPEVKKTPLSSKK